jgi:predicted nuclease of predicted toxin-antitoxin system
MLPPFLMDESIPDSVGDCLEAAGFTVQRVRDLVAPGTPDAAVARLSNERGAILIVNDRHYSGTFSPMTRSLVSLTRLRRLHRIGMRCREVHMARRIQELLTAIEFEYARFQQREDKRMYLEIGESYWRSHR